MHSTAHRGAYSNAGDDEHGCAGENIKYDVECIKDKIKNRIKEKGNRDCWLRNLASAGFIASSCHFPIISLFITTKPLLHNAGLYLPVHFLCLAGTSNAFAYTCRQAGRW